MKKFLLLTAAASLMMAGVAPEASAADAAGARKAKNETKSKVNRRKAAKEASNWLPTQIIISWYDGWSGQWENGGVTSMEYDGSGRLVKESDAWGGTEYEYNADGQVSARTYMYDMGSGLEPSGRYTYEYDSVVKDFVVKETYWIPENGGWMEAAVYGTDVERNSEGNVTKVSEYYINDDGEKEITEYFTVEYGSDGKASTMTLWYAEDGDDEMETQLTDIVWENTDGQFMEMDDDVDHQEFYVGANRIKSATIMKSDSQPQGSLINAIYADSLGSYAIDVTFNGESILALDHKAIDNYGSYEETFEETDLEYEGGTWTMGETYSSEESEMYDAYGLLVSSSYKSEEGGYTSESSTKAEIEYDETYGYPLVWTQYESYYGGDYVERERWEFLAYIQAGSTGAAVMSASSESAYYDLNGVRVNADRLAPGLYVERVGDKTRKILVK